MSSNEKRGVTQWFLLAAVGIGLVIGFLVNNIKLLDNEKAYQNNQKTETSIQEKD